MSGQGDCGRVEEVTCRRCDGAGAIDVLAGGGPDAVEVGVNCPNCGGTGAVQKIPSPASPAQDEGKREPRSHELKVWPEFFAALMDGSKTFEVRKDDRGFRVGDRLYLNEWMPSSQEYTSGQLCKVVTYILAGPAFGVERGFVVMGLADPEPDAFCKEIGSVPLSGTMEE